MNRIWIKLYLEILDDPKMGRLPDHLWRRVVELFLIAGKTGNDGKLPPIGEMAWTMRTTEDELHQCLEALSAVEYGIVHADNGQWFVSKFEKRQYSESYERVKRYRNAKSNGGSNADEAVSSSSSSSSNSYSDSEEGGGTGEGTIPETPRQAKEHPDIQAFESVCGRFPGARDYETIIDTIRYLREQHGDVVTYLKPYWTAWSTRKAKDGKPYSQASLVWLCEWAMQGEIPKANGHEPRSGETNQDKQAIKNKVKHANR